MVPDFYTAIVTGYDITNTYPQDTRIPVRKVWNDGNLPANLPASTTFHLLRDGVVFDSVTLSRANAASHNWEHVFHVGESQARGRSFSVIEDPVSGYIQTSAMEGDGTMVFT